MFASSYNNNSASLSNSNPSNPSSINLPKLAGPRPNPFHEQAAAKRFKPNLGGCRTRPFPENVKDEVKAVGVEFVRWRHKEQVIQPDINYQDHQEDCQPEGNGAIEEGDPEEGAPVRVSKNTKKLFNEKSSDASSNASTLASPVTTLFEYPENITELDLGQDTFESTVPALTESDIKKLLEKLEQEKGFICINISQSSVDPFLTFKCPAGHTFSSDHLGEITCPRCEVIIAKCFQYAKAHNGNVFVNSLGKLIIEKGEYVEFVCERDHVWKMKYSEW